MLHRVGGNLGTSDSENELQRHQFERPMDRLLKRKKVKAVNAKATAENSKQNVGWVTD